MIGAGSLHATATNVILNDPPPLKQRLIQQVGRSARLRVLNELKRTQGLCVADLADAHRA